jgi:hypothetical protein
MRPPNPLHTRFLVEYTKLRFWFGKLVLWGLSDSYFKNLLFLEVSLIESLKDLSSQLFPNQQPTELMTIAKLLNQLGLKLSVTVQEKLLA